MKDKIHSYIRNKKNSRVGVIMAKKVGNSVYLGWALTKTSAGDKFDRNWGLDLAEKRCDLPRGRHIPRSIKTDVEKMMKRGYGYFKIEPSVA